MNSGGTRANSEDTQRGDFALSQRTHNAASRRDEVVPFCWRWRWQFRLSTLLSAILATIFFNIEPIRSDTGGLPIRHNRCQVGLEKRTAE